MSWDAGNTPMPVKVERPANGKSLSITATGRSSETDYEKYVPEIEAAIDRFGKIRILLRMIGFHGWDAAALRADSNSTLSRQPDRTGREVITCDVPVPIACGT